MCDGGWLVAHGQMGMVWRDPCVRASVAVSPMVRECLTLYFSERSAALGPVLRWLLLSRNMLMAMNLVVLGYALPFDLLTHELQVNAKCVFERLLGNSTLSQSFCGMRCICMSLHGRENVCCLAFCQVNYKAIYNIDGTKHSSATTPCIAGIAQFGRAQDF